MRGIPFGLLFAERPLNVEPMLDVIYDESQDVSMIEEDGALVPVVTSFHATLGTETTTKVSGEDTDVD